jgi:hypothetical protein
MPFTIRHERLAVDLTGIIDLVDVEQHKVRDHKTLKDFKYTKTPAQLAADPQGVAYPGAAHLLLGWDFPLGFEHLYYCTEKVDIDESEYVFETKEAWQSQFEKLADTTWEMLDLSEVESVQDIPMPECKPGQKTPAACSAYGGCPFQQTCFSALMAGANTRTVVASLFPSKTKIEKPEDKAMGLTFKEKLELARKKKEAGESVVVTPALDSAVSKIMVAAASENESDPEFDEQEAAEIEAIKARIATLKNKVEKTVPVRHTNMDHTRVNPPDGTPANQVVPVEPRKRGRPSKADIAAREGVQQSLPVSVPGPLAGNPNFVETNRVTLPLIQRNKENNGGTGPVEGFVKCDSRGEEWAFHLYVGCRPRNVVATDLVEILAEFQDKVAYEAGVPHYGLLDFGQGNKRVASLVFGRLQADGFDWLPEHIMADRRFPGTDAVLEVLFGYKCPETGLKPFIVDKLG